MASITEELRGNQLTASELAEFFPEPAARYLVEFLESLSFDLNNALPQLQTQFGTGDPNGVITANYSGLYGDTATGDIWINDTPGSDTGWIQNNA